MDSSVSARTMRRLLRSRTSPDRYWDLKNKIQILAVRSGLKPAFTDDAAENTEFRVLATLFGLHYKITAGRPLRAANKLNVSDTFLKALIDVMMPKQAVWLFSDPNIESKISRCMAGELNIGHVLGYPQCCIEWHEGARATSEIESCFQQILERITNNPQMFIKARSEVELYSLAISEWQMPVPDYVFETMRLYPFAPHWACPSCLSHQSGESEKLSNQYREMAFRLSPKLAQEMQQCALER
jgi:hypothetical protein